MKPDDYADYLEHHALSTNEHAAESLYEIANWVRRVAKLEEALRKIVAGFGLSAYAGYDAVDKARKLVPKGEQEDLSA